MEGQSETWCIGNVGLVNCLKYGACGATSDDHERRTSGLDRNKGNGEHRGFALISIGRARCSVDLYNGCLVLVAGRLDINKGGMRWDQTEEMEIRRRDMGHADDNEDFRNSVLISIAGTKSLREVDTVDLVLTKTDVAARLGIYLYHHRRP